MPRSGTIRFGVFEIDPATGELSKSGIPVKLPPQPFKVLALLAARAGDLVTREEFQREIWGGEGERFVDFEHGLNVCIRQIRTALDDDPDDPRYIQTLPRRGYRFVATVDQVGDGSETPPVVATETAPSEALAVSEPSARPALWRAPALAGVTLVVLVTILLGLDIGGLRQGLRIPGVAPRIQSIAVLPLANLTGDPEQEYFVDGMTDALIGSLAQIRTLRVISRTSSMRYKDAKKSLREIARELQVDAVVEGAVVRAGQQVGIRVQLIHAASDSHLWAENYERNLREIAALQGDIATAIAREIQVVLTPEERSYLARLRTTDSEAYRAYLRGRHFWNKRTQEGLLKALEHFQQAIDREPTFAPAYAGLADSYALLGVYSVLPMQDVQPKAEAAVRKALALDDTLAEAHTSRAFLSAISGCDKERVEEAEKEYKRAIELNPNYATAYHWYSLFLIPRFPEALAAIKRARDLDPLSPIIQSDVGFVYYSARRYDEAIVEYKKALELDPGFETARLWLSWLKRLKGAHAEAIAEAERAYANSNNLITRINLACIYWQTGKKEKARPFLAELENEARTERAPARVFAGFYTGIQDKEKMLLWLEKAMRATPEMACRTEWDPGYDFIRADPRFQAMLQRVRSSVGQATQATQITQIP